MTENEPQQIPLQEEQLSVAERANQVFELAKRLKLSAAIFVFENNRSAIGQLALSDANAYQLFSAVKQLEMTAETLYMQDQIAEQQERQKRERLVVPRDHKRKVIQ